MKTTILLFSLVCAAVALSPRMQMPDCGRYGSACNRKEAPVCGTDFQTWTNECQLCLRIRETRNRKLAIMHQGECTKEELDVEKDPKMEGLIRKMREIPMP